MTRQQNLPCLLSALLAATLALPAARADWPRLRGPRNDGSTDQTVGQAGKFPGRKTLQVNVGLGCGSPILADGKLYALGFTGHDGGTDTLVCYDTRAGKLLWRQSYRSRKHGRVAVGDKGAYGGPSASPTFDPDTHRIYTLSVDGELRCWDAAAGGRLLWRRNLYDDFGAVRRPSAGGGQRDFGFTSSPLLLGDWVIVEAPVKSATVLAFEKADGKLAWRSACNRPAGHTPGPVPLRVDGKDALAVLTLGELVILSAEADRPGRTIARHPWKTKFACNIPSPAVWNGDHLLLTAGYNHRSSLLLGLTGDTLQPVRKLKAFATVSTPLVIGDRAWLINGPLRCVDLTTGKQLYAGGNFGHGSILATGDGKLIAFGKGRAVLLDAEADAYKPLAETPRLFKTDCYPHVALSGGILAMKDRKGNLVCYDLGTD